MTRTARIAIPLAVAIVAAACGGLPEDEFRDAVPTTSKLAFDVPTAAQASEPGKKTSALVGQRASLYLLTYASSKRLNGSVWVGLNMIEDIVRHRPSAVSGNHAVWGPFTPPLEPLTWRLIVRKEARPGHYSYNLAARPKLTPTAAFTTILAGTSQRGSGGYLGVYTANADALNSLDPQRYRDRGKMIATYNTTGARRFVNLVLEGYSDNGKPAVDLAYKYRALDSGAGHFRFVAKADVQKNGSAAETLAMVTAWDRSGAGRGEAIVTGGDLPSGVTLHMAECWDAGFGRVFYTDNVNKTEGSAAACAFGSAPATTPVNGGASTGSN